MLGRKLGTLTNSMELNLSAKAAGLSSAQAFPQISGNLKFIALFTRVVVSILRQMNPVHTAPFYFSEIQNVIILSLMSRYS
jgi:hypothetical protein